MSGLLINTHSVPVGAEPRQHALSDPRMVARWENTDIAAVHSYQIVIESSQTAPPPQVQQQQIKHHRVVVQRQSQSEGSFVCRSWLS